MPTFLAGDLGGTHCRLVLVRVDPVSESEVELAEMTYLSSKYDHLIDVMREFLKEFASPSEWPSACCFAVAGPVQNNTCIITNLKWGPLDGAEIARKLGMSHVVLVNDFVGVGYGLLALSREDIVPLNDVPPVHGAPKACVGAGTGLGETFLTYNGEDYDVWPAEGGHTDFAPRNDEEFELMKFIQKADGLSRVSTERVVSGMALPRIYQFFAHKYPNEVNPAIHKRIMTEDGGRVISENAKSGKCSLCRRTIEVFISSYGAEAGNMALKTLPFGGMYIAGGIAPKLLWAIQHEKRFMANYLDKGRMEKVLSQVPVYVVKHKNVGLLGAKVVCRRLLRKEGKLAQIVQEKNTTMIRSKL